MNELRDEVMQLFTRRMRTDAKLKKLVARARGSMSYEDANEVAIRLGELASDSMLQSSVNIEKFTEDIARELVTDPLTSIHELTSDVVRTVQQNMLDSAGSKLKSLTADLDTNRIDGFIRKLASYDNAQDAQWMLKEPIINYAQSVVDLSMRKNMRVNSEAGMKAKVIRRAEAHGTRKRIQRVRANGKIYSYQRTYEVPCKWCKDLAGTYDYDTVRKAGDDVWRRHDGCRCTLIYKLGNGVETTVWKKENSQEVRARVEREEKKRAEIEIRKQTRANMVNQVMMELGYSPKGASIFVNAYKDMIEKVGLEATIDFARHG